MSRAWLVTALLCLHAAAGASTSSQCTSATEFQPRLCKSNLPSIRSVSFVSAPPPDAAAAPECKGFRLSARQVRLFFRKARTVDAVDALHTLDWSPCSVGGELVLGDGRKARWQISQYQTGSLSIEGETSTMSMYCPACRYAPFRW